MRRLALVAAALLFAGCTPESLGGSLAQALSLEFDHVELAVDADAMRLSYLHTQKEGADVTFELVVLLAGLTVEVPMEIDLASRLDAGQPRATASRLEANDPVLFPPITSGTLSLEVEPLTQKKLAGNFGLHFASDASTRHVGLGLTVHGTFGGTVEQVTAP